MPELQVPQTGEIIASGSFGQPVVFRVLSRYTNAAQRDALAPSPGNGEPAWVQDISELQVYDGTQWVTYQQRIQTLTDQVYLDEGAPSDWRTSLNFTWTGDGTITMAYYLDPPIVDPWASHSTPSIVPVALRPSSDSIHGLMSAYSAGGTQGGLTQGRGIRATSSGVLVYESVAQVEYDNPETYRGTLVWHVGAAGSVDLAP